MGLFNLFRRRQPTIPLPQLCYDVAYFILPNFAFHDLARIVHMAVETPGTSGLLLHVMACHARKVEPAVEDGRRLRWHHGRLDAHREYFLLEYPTPPPVDMSNLSLQDAASPRPPIVLAPYFTAVVRGGDAGDVQYYVLGQAPFGGTTLRCVLREGMNCNLGPGPEPEKEAFLAAIRCQAQLDPPADG